MRRTAALAVAPTKNKTATNTALIANFGSVMEPLYPSRARARSVKRAAER